MTQKYTRGPWKIQTDDKGFYWIDKITKDGGFSICNCGTAKNAEANALLIATAPKLLKTCKIMTALCRLKYGNLDKKVYKEILKSEQAIAKAENKQ